MNGCCLKSGFFPFEALQKIFGSTVSDKEDLQQIRMEIEKAKIRLTTHPKATMKFELKQIGKWTYEVNLIHSFFFKVNVV